MFSLKTNSTFVVEEQKFVLEIRLSDEDLN